jgi:FtsP/CotA-like multicopper oxidase with cupredoxin domain
MSIRDIYLKIETLPDYCPVAPTPHVSPPIQYERDCARNPGHEDGTIPADEVGARRLTALIYREYLDAGYLMPKPDKLVVSDVNEPPFNHRVPGTVIYAHPGERLRIHVKNSDIADHSFHVHGLRYGIDSDGSWPFGTQSSDGRRSDEICPGQAWTYTFDISDDMLGAWPFHDHYRNISANVNRGLFGGIIVLPTHEHERLPCFPLPAGLHSALDKYLNGAKEPSPGAPTMPPMHTQKAKVAAMPSGGMPGMGGGAMPGMGGAGTPGNPMRPGHVMDMSDLPQELVPYAALLDELAHAPQDHLFPKPPHTLHVPMFLHQMSGARQAPVFQSAPLASGATFTSPPFTFAASYKYICGVHGASMAGEISVVPGGPSSVSVNIVDFQFVPTNVTVGVGGQVSWFNSGPSLHSVVEQGGDSLPSFCLNGRSFVGNTPTIATTTGQKIRWYVFNLDLSMGWHNFHTHAQRWKVAGEAIDIRSIGPAESFVFETTAPPVLLLPPDIEKHQHEGTHRHGAHAYHLRGDFLFHCHVEMHMMQGLAGLVRASQTVYLTKAEAFHLRATSGLPLDPGGNSCPAVDMERCKNAMGGKWEELPNLPEITMMHAVLLANSSRVLFWGYGPRADQSRLWDQATNLFTQPAPQPQALSPDQNIWSGAHARLNDAAGTILAHGGFRNNPAPPLTLDTERRAFSFDPTTNAWSHATETHTGRFYPTTITLGNGSALTLFGQDNGIGGGATAASFEIFTPGGAGSWSSAQPLPFNYFYYPWTFLLPDGELFIAGPQKPARRFRHTVTPVIDDPAKQYQQISSQRGVNMDGTAALLALRPPNYEPRVLIAGGQPVDAMQSAEWIDLAAPSPAWQALPNMNVPRDKMNSVLLPDGRLLVVGGIETLPDGGPAELFDPEDPGAGFSLGPSMRYRRGYHSTAILLPDGSVLVGGDPNGGATPNERYLPPYFFMTRPTLTSAPATVAYGTAFTVHSPNAAAISRVVLMRPGAVTHGFNQAQRHVECVITSASGTSIDVVAPANGNIAPPGHYLVFIVDHDRVPSMGAWLKLS